MANVLYIIYNADASLTGKLKYGYRKLTAPKDEPACAACDITHGGLHLDETAEWKKAKGEIAQGQQLEMKQLHRDELDASIKQFIDTRKLRYPMVVSSTEGHDYKLVMDNVELASCDGNAQIFVMKLKEKGVIGMPGTPSL